MKNSRKILVPLATLAAAGAIAIGSGATFTSTTANTISSVTSGTLTHTNSKADAAVFTLTNLKPGDTLTGSLTLKNTGSLPAAFSLTEKSSTNGFTGANLTLEIKNATTGGVVYTGTFGGLEDGLKKDIGQIAPDVSNKFDFTVKLAQGADNTDQGKNATATYTWDSVQLEGSTFNQ